MRTRLLAALAPILALAPLAPLAAQEPLTFERAVEIARENNPGFLQQLNAVAAAEYAERSSMGNLLPSLNANLGFGGSTFSRKIAEDDFGNPIGGSVENTTSSASQSLGGGLPLFNLQTIRSYGSARAATAVQEAVVEVREAQLRTTVGQAYFQAVQAERLIEVEERQLESARQQLAAVRQLLRLAARQPTDVLGAELDVATAEQSLQGARGTARKAQLLLRQVMGVSLDRDFNLATGFPEVFDPASLNVDGLIARALDQGPVMAQEEARVEAAERGLGVARAGRYPSINGNYNWGRSTSAQQYGAIGEFGNLPNQSWGFQLGVSIPLFNRFSTWAQVGQRELDLDNAREALRGARLQLERDLRAAVIDLESAYSDVQLAERRAEIARERLRQGQELYRQGTLDYTSLQQMINGVAAAERSVVGAHASFASALLALEERLGGPVALVGGS